MNPTIEAHLNRIRVGVDPNEATNSLSVSGWISQNTTLQGKPFSYKDHEYQKTLLDDPAKIKYCIKCSQVGISELSVRRIIAMCQLHAEINAMIVLPTAAFASTFSTTRLSTALDSSKVARENLYKTDSASVRRFINNSYIYMKGASRGSQAISIPVDVLAVDEIDFSEDQSILTAFESRMTHSRLSEAMWFSTPTVNGYGISHLFDNSLQHVEMQKCSRCNHHFVPDYYNDVKLPGFNAPINMLKGPANAVPSNNPRSLKEINFFSKALLTQFQVDTAYLACPKCQRPIDQDIKYRQYVIVNPNSNFDEHGYRISPFSAPKFVPPSKMLRKSTAFKSLRDFINNTLGLAHDDETTGLSEQECSDLFTTTSTPLTTSYQVLGLDFGGTCACLTAQPLFDAGEERLIIHSAQQIPLYKIKTEYMQLLARHRVISSVADAMPYTTEVSALQDLDHRLFACMFSNSKSLELFQLREKEEDETKAMFGLRQISAKKDALMDFVVANIRAGKIIFAQTESNMMMRNTIIKHLRDPKRIKIDTAEGKGQYVWRKSPSGEDHFFLALAYLLLANAIKGLHGSVAPLPLLLSKIKLTNKDL